ncbi:MAG: MBL fold metallo-hydrolase [Bacteroidetes bacterium]|nr:MBL fold metallo-hydrolase [Bacteroidota bacterium]
MKVTFLGTGTSQGVPIIGCTCNVCKSNNNKDNRLRSSVYIETGGKFFVIDTGPDFRQQLLREKILKLDAVIFTHSHKDHICGFDDIRAFNYINKKPVEVYLEEYVLNAIKRDFFYIFDEFKYPGVPEANFHIIKNEGFFIEGIKIIPIRVHHYKMPVLGFRIGNFSYITDANSISRNEIEKIKNSEVLVINALRKESHISHFSLNEAIEMAKTINANQTYITHISHQMGLHNEVNAELPSNIKLAWDGLKIEIND